MKDLKDWSKQITGLDAMEAAKVHDLYADMLATAHDIGYKVPNEQLIETEDAEAIRKVIAPLHEGLMKYHAEAKVAAKEKAEQAAKAPAKPASTKPAKAAAQKKPDKAKKEDKTMATEGAKKAAKKAPAKKAAAKKAAKAPAKKAAKKAASANARTGTGRIYNPYGDNAVIKVLKKENPARPDSERGKRIAVVLKYAGKKVADFFSKEKPPYNRNDTLTFMVEKGLISIK